MALNKETPDEEWRAKLEPFEYKVLRKKGTEPRGGECTSAHAQPFSPWLPMTDGTLMRSLCHR